MPNALLQMIPAPPPKTERDYAEAEASRKLTLWEDISLTAEEVWNEFLTPVVAMRRAEAEKGAPSLPPKEVERFREAFGINKYRAYLKSQGIDEGTSDRLPTLSKEEWEKSDYFRPGIKWNPRMTENWARVMAEEYDAREKRRKLLELSPGGFWRGAAKLGVSFLVGALDPVNYIPIFGSRAASLAIKRFGAIKGRALVSAGEAVVGTAIADAGLVKAQTEAGDQMAWENAAWDLMMAGPIGAMFGAGVGVLARRKGRAGQALATAVVQHLEDQEVDVSHAVEGLEPPPRETPEAPTEAAGTAKEGEPAPQPPEPEKTAQGPGETPKQTPLETTPTAPQPEPEAVPPILESDTALPARDTVKTMTVDELHVDPKRFQYKVTGIGEGGVGKELKSIKRFDPDLGGVLLVWRDPKDGLTYVVNGHHRYELAKRTGHKELLVRYVDAPDEGTARLKGALVNIAESRGTAVDAAKLFRETGLTADMLQESFHVSMRGAIAKTGMELAQLNDRLFNMVATGRMTEGRGAAIGRALPDHAKQDALVALIQKRERSGRPITNQGVEELARFVAHAGEVRKEQQTLFGKEVLSHPLAVEMAEVMATIKARLRSDKKLFGAVARETKKERLEAVGNKIAVAENKRREQEAAAVLEIVDALAMKVGPIHEALKRAAEAMANGKNKRKAAEEAYEAIRAVVSEMVKGRMGRSPDVARQARGRRRIDTRTAAERPVSQIETPREKTEPPPEVDTAEVAAVEDLYQAGKLKRSQMVLEDGRLEIVDEVADWEASRQMVDKAEQEAKALEIAAECLTVAGR